MLEGRKRADLLLEPEDCLLVIIDMQERLVPVVAERELLISNVVKLLKFAKVMSLPVIFTEQEKLGPTIREIKEAYEGTNVVPKIHFNAFFSEEFRKEVEGFKRKTLILAGIECHICVLQTALYALNDYNVHVLEDAVSSRNLKDKSASIERMRSAGCVISTTEILFFELLKRAGTDLFRSTLSLIRNP